MAVVGRGLRENEEETMAELAAMFGSNYMSAAEVAMYHGKKCGKPCSGSYPDCSHPFCMRDAPLPQEGRE